MSSSEDENSIDPGRSNKRGRKTEDVIEDADMEISEMDSILESDLQSNNLD